MGIAGQCHRAGVPCYFKQTGDNAVLFGNAFAGAAFEIPQTAKQFPEL
jgi:hypothetical protein